MSRLAAPAPRLAEAKPLTFVDHVANIYHLVIKELRSIRADPVMLVLVIYSFSISVNTVATGAVTEATNLSVGIVDEDGSDLSRRIAEGAAAADLPAAGADHGLRHRPDDGPGQALCSSSKSRPNFEADVRAERKTGVQINVDATAVAQAGNGASYLQNVVANEVQRFISGREGARPRADQSRGARRVQPEPKTSWFSAVTQVINQITMLTVILTGAALIREREQGTVEHLLVMPVVPAEIMLAKMIANGLVILVAATLSLQFVVHWWIGSPINGSLLLFLFGAGDLCSRRRGARHPARHARHDHGPVRPARHARAGGDAIAVRQQHADGEHAGLAAVSDADDQPDAAFRRLRPGGAVPRRRHHARLAAAGGDARHRRRLFRLRPAPLPQGHFRRLSVEPRRAIRLLDICLRYRGRGLCKPGIKCRFPRQCAVGAPAPRLMLRKTSASGTAAAEISIRVQNTSM